MNGLARRWPAAVFIIGAILAAGLGAGAQTRSRPSPPEQAPNMRPLLGIRAMAIEGQLGQYFQVPGGRGILVVDVMSGTPAEKAGMKAGDVIYQVEGKAVQGAGQLEQALRNNCSANGVSIAIVRKGMPLVLRVQIDCSNPPGSSNSRVLPVGNSLGP